MSGGEDGGKRGGLGIDGGTPGGGGDGEVKNGSVQEMREGLAAGPSA